MSTGRIVVKVVGCQLSVSVEQPLQSRRPTTDNRQPTTSLMSALLETIPRHWGYDSFRPLQHAAMQAVLDGRDSLVVMPTGGGKSLCYQVPAVMREAVTLVVSPLISLMKDQVDR